MFLRQAAGWRLEAGSQRIDAHQHPTLIDVPIMDEAGFERSKHRAYRYTCYRSGVFGAYQRSGCRKAIRTRLTGTGPGADDQNLTHFKRCVSGLSHRIDLQARAG